MNTTSHTSCFGLRAMTRSSGSVSMLLGSVIVLTLRLSSTVID